MSREAVEILVDRWMNEPEFRAEMRQDPQGTVKRTGAALDDDEWAALSNIDWNASDEELQSRVSKQW